MNTRDKCCKKAISLLLAAIMMCFAFFGCANRNAQNKDQNKNLNKAALVGNIPISFPLVSDSQTLNILIAGFNGKDQKDVFVWQKYEELTGVNVNWTSVTKEERAEVCHNALTNNQQYDLIMRCKVSSTKLLRYGKSGLILDLAKDGLLQENAPNCWKYLQSHPDALASVMNPDGTIYALPQVNSGAELRVGVKMFVNKKWLEHVHMELPTTTEELRALLLVFKEQDANGNSDPNDEIPLCVDWNSYKSALCGSFGLQNRGMHNEIVDCDPVSGKVRMIAASEQYKEFLEYTNKLYADNLIDQNIFDMSLEQMTGDIAEDKVGIFINTNLALLPADKTDNWIALDEALTGPNGDKMWSGIRANFHSTGAAILPSTCNNPELVLKWLDYFWTDQGTLFYHMGIEGETFSALEDGTYDYLPKIYEDIKEKNLSFDEVVSDYTPYPGGNNPTVEIAPYFKGGEMAEIPATAAKKLIEYGPKEYWPSFTFTQEENDKLDEIKNDIGRYCNSMCVDFITGTRSFEEWNTYTAQLQKLRAEEETSIYQAAVDRYHALITALN